MIRPIRCALLTLALGATGCPKVEPAAPAAPFPSTLPTVQADYTWSPQPPTVTSTVAGAQLWHIHRPGLPLVSLRVVFPGGSALDPADQPGLTAFADAMLLRGSGDQDAAAFSAALQQHAIDIDVSTSRSATVVSVDCTTEALPVAMKLLDQALSAPRFDADEVDRARGQRIQGRKDDLDEPRFVASTVGWAQWFGPDHPYSHPTSGTIAGLEAATPEALAHSWATRSRLEGARWVVVGDVDQSASLALIQEHFGDWSTGEAPAPLPAPPPGRTTPHAKGGRILVDNPGASQTVLRVWMPGWVADDPQRVAGDLGTVALGGTFTSRLNSLLREEKGYTYGAGAYVISGQNYGAIQVSTNVFIDTTADALRDLTAELKRISEGVTEDEVGKAEASRRTDAIEVAASRSGTANQLASLVVDGRNADGQLADLHMAARAEKGDIDRALANLSLDDSLVVIVGDLARIRESVESALPGEWVELSSEGKPLP